MKSPARFLLLFALGWSIGSAAPLAWRTTTYTAHDKQKTPVRGESAQLTTPEDPARPDGPVVRLALLKLPATTKTPGSPIVYLHGGPGGSGAEHLEQPEFRALFAALQAQADVIILDQRGCGQSMPALVPSRDSPRLSIDSLATRENFLGYLEQTSVAVRDRLAQDGHDARHFTILESAADIEALRVALGVPKIQLFAHSYGTQLAQTFARMHPDSVARMVLVGARGMDTSRKLPADADAFLAQLAALARTDQTVGEKFPDLLATLRRVLAKLDANSVAVELENERKEKFTLEVGGYALRFIIAKFYLHDPDNSKYLPKLLDELDTGRRPWSLVFNLTQLVRSPISYAWLTTDAASGVSEPRAAQITEQARTAMLADAMNFPFPAINRVWQMPDLGDAFRAPVQTSIPTLFVAGTLDGITPVEQTRAILRTFSNASLLVVENGGHNSQLRPTEVVSAIARFFGGNASLAHARMPVPTFVPLITKEAR